VLNVMGLDWAARFKMPKALGPAFAIPGGGTLKTSGD
jgi:hypothetical protein